jgi:hypothetical protein
MKRVLPFVIISLLLSCCVPDNLKEKLNEGIMTGHKMIADQEFKRALANIELHKLRTGSYPVSLSDLKFLSAMDSTMFGYVEYTRLDTAYELNVKMDVPSLTDGTSQKLELRYPAEFWNGLGCVRSNVK